MRGYIYKITNKINGKSYIGQTRYTTEERWKQHILKSKSRHSKFYNAIRKYGIDNFSVETIEECDIEKLDSREIFYIAHYNTFLDGYNSTAGNVDSSGASLKIDTDDKYDEICQLYYSGMSVYKIGLLYGIDKCTVYKLLKSLGIKFTHADTVTFTEEEFKELVLDYQQGCSLSNISKKYGYSRKGITQYLLNHGVDLRKKYNIFKDEEAQQNLIDDYLDPSSSVRDLLAKHHCDLKSLKRILSKYGIDHNKKSFKVSDAKCLECIRLHNVGMPVAQISKKTGVNKSTIYGIFRRNHVK